MQITTFATTSSRQGVGLKGQVANLCELLLHREHTHEPLS